MVANWHGDWVLVRDFDLSKGSALAYYNKGSARFIIKKAQLCVSKGLCRKRALFAYVIS